MTDKSPLISTVTFQNDFPKTNNFLGGIMTIEKLDEDLMIKCIDNHKLQPTIFSDCSANNCPDCDTEIVNMMMARFPNVKSGFIPPKNVFLFAGCPNCCTMKYDKDQLLEYAGKKCSLREYIIEEYDY
ncbi:MAG: hypothetical protein WC836_05590 [Desulfobacula sp.]